MLSAILAAALAASSPAPAETKTEDVITMICVERFAENVKLVAEGGEPNSLVIPLLGLSDDAAAFVTQQCDMFDKGAIFALSLRAAPQPEKPNVEEDDDGRVPDRSQIPIAFSRR